MIDMIVQIYAFTQIEQAQAAAELGVDHIGFIAGDYGLVPGELSFRQSAELARALPNGATAVALTMATGVDEILRMAEAVEPDIIHISTDPEDVGPDKMEALRSRLPGSIRLMKAIHVDDAGSIRLAREFSACSDLILLDTKVRGMPGVGATGKTHDWQISRQIVEAVRIPVILAGGLSADNVGAAIAAVLPWGVDSNTHTNVAGDPAAKDMERVRAFVAAARKAQAACAEADPK